MDPRRVPSVPLSSVDSVSGPEIQPPPSTVQPAPADAGLELWQKRLLPFMVWMVGGLTVFFLAATLFQLHSLQDAVEHSPELDLTSALAPLQGTAASSTDRLVFAQWQTLASLEQHAIERRYHQANVLLMSRTWTRYLGFMTGMILALVGCAFILGKLREEVSTLGVETEGVKANIQSTSPGLVLCALGTVLMMTALLAHNDIETQDTPLYTAVQVTTAPDPGAAPSPRPLPGTDEPSGSMTDPLEGLELGDLQNLQPDDSQSR